MYFKCGFNSCENLMVNIIMKFKGLFTYRRTSSSIRRCRPSREALWFEGYGEVLYLVLTCHSMPSIV